MYMSMAMTQVCNAVCQLLRSCAAMRRRLRQSIQASVQQQLENATECRASDELDAEAFGQVRSIQRRLRVDVVHMLASTVAVATAVLFEAQFCSSWHTTLHTWATAIDVNSR